MPQSAAHATAEMATTKWKLQPGPSIEHRHYARLVAVKDQQEIEIALVALDHEEGPLCAQLLVSAPKLFRTLERIEDAIVADLDTIFNDDDRAETPEMLAQIRGLIEKVNKIPMWLSKLRQAPPPSPSTSCSDHESFKQEGQSQLMPCHEPACSTPEEDYPLFGPPTAAATPAPC